MSSDITSHLLYPLSHANIFHLAANTLCLWMIRVPVLIFVTYPIAVLASFLPSFVSEPTMGFSGILFAMVAITWGRVHRFRDMFWKNKWYIIIPALLPHINVMIHVYCMIGGYLYGRYGARS